MRILIANKFYYNRGGDCIYAINLEKILASRGHEVAFFAMQYPDNLPSKWSKYWPSEVSFKPGPKIFGAFARPFGIGEVKTKFAALLEDFKPDVVHLGNIHSQLSPVIAEIAHKKGIKVVWTIHDYKLLCPRYDCLKNGKEACELCFADKTHVLKNKCMKGSMVASTIAYFEAKKWSQKRLDACVDTYICPSRFMAEKMLKGGFDKSKVLSLCNFIDVQKCQKDGASQPARDYYCFLGRLSHEKGVETLINAASALPYKLVVIGGGPLEEYLKSKNCENISFVGFKQWDEIKRIVSAARFVVVPSECYENNPLSIIESKCLGTPVLGARIGGIPELIDEGFSGMTFESRNTNDLSEKIEQMWNAQFDYEQIAQNSMAKYTADQYCNALINIYQN